MYILNNSVAWKLIGLASLCVMLTTGCQTTNRGFDKERDVDISETRIELPQELYALKGFKIKKATIKENGSYRRETVTFTGGFFSFDRYLRGGILQTSKDKFTKLLTKHYSDFKVLSAIKKANLKIGDVYYATVQNDDQTCFVISGNYGTSMMTRGGTGYPGATIGAYCEPGAHPKLEEGVMTWLKLVHLR